MRYLSSAFLPTHCAQETYGFFSVKGKAILVTGRGGTKGCDTSRLPHTLENWSTDGGEVGLARWPSFTHRKVPGTRRMTSSGMRRRVALARTDVSEEHTPKRQL
jgi:hypothetical protein